MRLNHGAYYWVPYIDGKQAWHPLGKDFASAFEKYGRLEADRHDETGTTFDDLERRFFLEVAPTKAANTQKSWRSWIKPLRLVFSGGQVAAIRQRDAAQYIDRRSHKVSANREIALLSVMLAHAARWGWIDANPLRGFAKAPEQRRMRYITDDELARLITAAEAAGDRILALLIRMAYYTALRKSDLLGLRWADWRDDGLHVATQKTGAPLVFQPTPELLAIRQELVELQGKIRSLWVFANARGRKINAVTADHRWMALRDGCGLGDVVFHDLRRKRLTDVTDLRGREFAQRLAGHKEARTTARYYAPEAVRIDLNMPGEDKRWGGRKD